MEPFNHGFTNPLSDKTMAEMIGYSKAMRNLYDHLESVTGFKPENRMIDSVILLDKITASVNSIQEVIDKEQDAVDNMATTILSGTKPDNNERS